MKLKQERWLCWNLDLWDKTIIFYVPVLDATLLILFNNYFGGKKKLYWIICIFWILLSINLIIWLIAMHLLDIVVYKSNNMLNSSFWGAQKSQISSREMKLIWVLFMTQIWSFNNRLHCIHVTKFQALGNLQCPAVTCFTSFAKIGIYF